MSKKQIDVILVVKSKIEKASTDWDKYPSSIARYIDYRSPKHTDEISGIVDALMSGISGRVEAPTLVWVARVTMQTICIFFVRAAV